jgi:hypothetical protein
MARIALLAALAAFLVGCSNDSNLSKGDQEALQDRLSKPVSAAGTPPGAPGGQPAGGPPKDSKPGPTGQ